MRVPVDQAGVPVDVDMRFRRRPWSMAVLVVLIVHMNVLMLHRLMGVLVMVLLGQVEPEPDGHQRTTSQERYRDRLAQQQDRRAGADKRCQRVVSAGSGSPQVPQGQHEERQRDAVAEEPE